MTEEEDRIRRAAELAVENERLVARVNQHDREIGAIRAEMAAVRTEVAKNTVEVGKVGMSLEFLTLRLFGGPSPNDGGEFGKLYDRIGGHFSSIVLKYLVGIACTVVAGVVLYLVLHGKP